MMHFPACSRCRILTALALSEIIGIRMYDTTLFIDDKVTVWTNGDVRFRNELITQLDEHQTEAVFNTINMHTPFKED